MAETIYDTEEQVDEPQQEDPKPKLKVKDFAAKIKTKYPEYKDVDDLVLTNKIIAKYPDYKDQVDFGVEKKNQVGSPLSVSQLPSGSSNGKLPSSYGLEPPKEQTSTTDNLPSTSNLKIGATDARVGGDVFDEAPKSAKVIGGVYNTLVESAARIAGGLGTMAQDLSAPVNTDLWTTPRKPEERAKFSEPQGEFRKAASGVIEKARLPVSSKENEAKLGEFDVHKKTLGQNLAALAFSAPSMVADVMAGTATGGGTFILQGVNDADEEIEKNPDAQNLPEGVKMGYKYTAGLVNAALMKFNFDKVLHGTGVDKWVTKNITDKVVKGFIDAGIKATKEDIEAAVTKEVASLATKAQKVGLKTAVGALTGTGTGAAMGASHAGLHELVNLEEGKEVFDTKDIGNDILNSAANLGLFSAITGGAGALRGGKEAEVKSPENIEEPKPTTELPKETPTVEGAVIEIGGKTYEGKNHAEAILKAKEDGQDISQVDRKAEGKFKLSDGTIIDREEAKQKFGQDRSELLIPQDEASKQADKDYEKQKSVPEGGGEVKPTQEQQLKDIQNGDVVTFTYKSDAEVPEVFKDKISSRGETNGEPTIRVTVAKSLADYELSKEPKQPINEQETIPKGDTENKQSQLQAERDAKIEEAHKPDIKIDFIPSKELVDSKDPVGNKLKHTEIKEKFKDLRKILDCLWP